jgi:cytochrome b6-f complex iron-sulfur subunit
MAERPSVKDILARVRAAGPAKAEESAPEPEAAAAPEPAGAPPPAASAPPPPAAPPAPTPASLGRPLTLKEKLAAAKGRPAGAEPAAPAASAPPPAAAPAEVEAPAAQAAPTGPPPSAAPQLTPEALGRPLTLKEKLAAARAGGGSAPAPTPAGAKPAAKPAAGAAPAAAASTRPLPPLEQMSDPKDLAEALRRAGAAKEKSAKAAVAEKAPAARPARRAESKAVPPRPSKADADAGQTATAPATRTAPAPEAAPSRRRFLGDAGWIAAGWAAFIAAMGSFTAMSVRFFFPNVLAEPPSTIKVGIPTNFEMGEVNENWKAEWGFWIVRSNYYDGEDKIYALSSTCTHLGCPPAWLPAEQKFKCPCHGSGFYVSGVNFEGPAPRPLERFKITLGDDGQLVVDKAAKYQEELGQWTDPESFFKA